MTSGAGNRFVVRRSGRPPVSFRERELQALALYARTGSHKDAAALMGIGPQTVKNYLATSYQKLGVSGGIEAFRAIGWLQVPE
jgi:DNA-binding NarL/FixJ family response regulator